jgi:hypothetical protein
MNYLKYLEGPGGTFRGIVVAGDDSSRQIRLGRLIAPPAAATAMASLPALPRVPAVPNLLAGLQDLQIESVAVLPKVDASLAEVKTSIKSVATASASVKPAPDRVSDIKTSIGSAGSKASAELAAL